MYLQALAIETMPSEESPKAEAPPTLKRLNWWNFSPDWRGFAIHSFFHFGFLGGLYVAFTTKVLWTTWVLCFVWLYFGELGVTAGAHRLWSHRSYKARTPLRILLVLLFTLATQGDLLSWVQDHRVHHKYSETDADPHNAKRGFFFSHIGWLLCKRHTDVIKKMSTVNMDDLLADPVVMFQKSFFLPLFFVVSVVIPTATSVLLGESLLTSFLLCGLGRICVTHHNTWLVNSAAHIWGNRPYDATINPRENMLVAFLAIGEGFHNYHHTFPKDYSTSEFGSKLNSTTWFIELMAKLGQAYDLKTPSAETIELRKSRTGDNYRPPGEFETARPKMN